mmetsp:Transcript_16729/g.52708  ORF Transcript_16729/g.52708 Transcript_16729/m.52708 type:complete len:133 (-) Transcript_16729:436-834(-)
MLLRLQTLIPYTLHPTPYPPSRFGFYDDGEDDGEDEWVEVPDRRGQVGSDDIFDSYLDRAESGGPYNEYYSEEEESEEGEEGEWTEEWGEEDDASWEEVHSSFGGEKEVDVDAVMDAIAMSGGRRKWTKRRR